MVRLKDIAARGGVSVMTVSKVMRDAPDISAATKARIRRLADEMGYVPDSAAQSLRNANHAAFGSVIPAITNPVFWAHDLAIEDLAHEQGYELVLAHTHNLPEREEAVHPQAAVTAGGWFVYLTGLSAFALGAHL